MGLLKVALPTFCLLLSINALRAQSGSKKVEEGNALFAEEKYDEANTKYRDALIEVPDSPIVNFNIGDVEYKKRNFEEALKAYQECLTSDDILLQSKAYYNIGNTVYQLGKLPESIQYYKKALELNPEDQDAKYNLEYVRAKLKDNSEKQQSDQNQQNNDKQEKIEPSENAKKLLTQAKILVAQREYPAAHTLMTEGMKTDKTVAAYQDFITRIKDVIDIQD